MFHFLGSLQHWEILGSAIATTDYVRLTPDHQSKQGAVWQIMVWVALYTFSIDSDRNDWLRVDFLSYVFFPCLNCSTLLDQKRLKIFLLKKTRFRPPLSDSVCTNYIARILLSVSQVHHLDSCCCCIPKTVDVG